MIFVTVGTQVPFDRMVRTIDQWAGEHSDGDFFAQIGPAKYRPKNIPWAEFLDADECRRKIEQADVVVAHAGMGSILTALELNKPIVVMPRLSALGEHRNDHQLATAKRLLAQGRIVVAFDERELLEKLEYFKTLRPAERIEVHASSALLATIRGFVAGENRKLPLVVHPLTASMRDVAPSSEPIAYVHSNPERLQTESVETAVIGPKIRRATTLTGFQRESPYRARGPRTNPHRERFALDTGLPASPATIEAGLAAVILLAGRLRATDLAKRIGRSRLDLPIDAGRSLLAYWCDEAAQLMSAWDCAHLAVRVLIDRASPMPTLPSHSQRLHLTVERDQTEFRGTGGLLRDVCDQYDDDAWVLVANAAQILFEPLHVAASKLAAAGGEVNVVNEDTGIPNGLILLKCSTLRAVSDVGFHDLKEQVVPALARRMLVKVIAAHGSTSSPIHSLPDYVAALRRHHGDRTARDLQRDSFEERWQSRFLIREQGAVIAASAKIRDSVVLEGAVVDDAAVIVRSVVGRGARVAPRQVVVDQVLDGIRA